MPHVPPRGVDQRSAVEMTEVVLDELGNGAHHDLQNGAVGELVKVRGWRGRAKGVTARRPPAPAESDNAAPRARRRAHGSRSARCAVRGSTRRAPPWPR